MRNNEEADRGWLVSTRICMVSLGDFLNRIPGTFVGSCRWMQSQRSILCSKESLQRGERHVMEPAVVWFIGLFMLLASLFFYRAQKIEALEQRGVRVAAIVTA